MDVPLELTYIEVQKGLRDIQERTQRSARLSRSLDNLVENEIRPITLGRKNYLFYGSHEAAMNMCIVNSLLATCRNHDVNPRLYLNDIISQMPYMTKETHEKLVELIPHKWKALHPEAIMTKLRDEV